MKQTPHMIQSRRGFDHVSDRDESRPNAASLTPPKYDIDVVDRDSELPVQLKGAEGTVGNRNGLPDSLKAGLERLSGLNLSGVRVHYNSAKPAQLKALAYTQGRDIYVGPGQEQSLPHEGWHVVQQMEGRVRPMKARDDAGPWPGKLKINDSVVLEREADVMGRKAARMKETAPRKMPRNNALSTGNAHNQPVQRLTGYEAEAKFPIYGDYFDGRKYVKTEYLKNFTRPLGLFLFGGLEYGLFYGKDPYGHFTISADHNEVQKAHTRLFDLLALSGFFKAGISPKTMSCIEYITPPRDETGRSGAALMVDDLKAISKHAKYSLNLAKKTDGNAPIPHTADHILTGIPRTDLKAWVLQHKGNWAMIGGALKDLEGVLGDQLYVQETSGILPEDFPDLFMESAMKVSKSHEKWAPIIRDILLASVSTASNTLARRFPGGNGIPPAFKKHWKAARGYLTYLAQYLIADSLSLTEYLGGSVDKNLFVFLPRASLKQSFSALPMELQAESVVWHSLIAPFIFESEKFGPHYWSKYVKVSEPRPTSLVFEEAGKKNKEMKVLNKPFESRPKARRVLKTLFSGGDPKEKFKRPMESLDQPHTAIEKATGQKGIAVEDRFFHDRVKATISMDEFPGVAFGSFMKSQERLIKHVPFAAGALAPSSGIVPDYRQIAKTRIKGIEHRLFQEAPKKLQKAIEESQEEILTWEEDKKDAISRIKILTISVKNLQQKYDELEILKNKVSQSESDVSEKIKKLTTETQSQDNKTLDNNTAQVPNERNIELEKLQKEKVLLDKKEEEIENLIFDAGAKLDEETADLEVAKNDFKDAELGIRNENEEIKVNLQRIREIEQRRIGVKSKFSKLNGHELLLAWNRLDQEMSHELLRRVHKPLELGVSPKFYLEAQDRLLNSVEMGVARAKRSKLALRASKDDSGQLGLLLEEADKALSTFNEIKKLRFKTADPHATGLHLSKILQAARNFVQMVDKAERL